MKLSRTPWITHRLGIVFTNNKNPCTSRLQLIQFFSTKLLLAKPIRMFHWGLYRHWLDVARRYNIKLSQFTEQIWWVIFVDSQFFHAFLSRSYHYLFPFVMKQLRIYFSGNLLQSVEGRQMGKLTIGWRIRTSDLQVEMECAGFVHRCFCFLLFKQLRKRKVVVMEPSSGIIESS